jgi:NADPH-dependent curcumin reductase CurA
VKGIGITSTAEKVAKVTAAGVADVSVAYRAHPATENPAAPNSLSSAVAEAAGGLPVVAYLDSVGGWISTQVFEAMAPDARVVLCGQISTYDDDVPYPPPLSAASAAVVEQRRLKRERYLVLRHQARFGEAQAHLGALLGAGSVQLLSTVHHGLGAAPEAMVGVMEGRNVGKMLVRCAEV